MRFCFRLFRLCFWRGNHGNFYFFILFLRLLYALFRLRCSNFNGRRDCWGIYHANDGLCLLRRPRRDHARTVHNGFDLPLPQRTVFSERKLNPISDLDRQTAGQIRIRTARSLHLNRAIVIHRAVVRFCVCNRLCGHSSPRLCWFGRRCCGKHSSEPLLPVFFKVGIFYRKFKAMLSQFLFPAVTTGIQNIKL